ncbi:Hypothetical protein CINCED_3A006070 [Cinara cedri]|uniref:Uncharacterized protein n=1 Tax=Cinara cedri TaxID=506608 RepID=A0A5E4MJQ4_9HEMI|nr:Hypothetical protein CINCED_3A006070 [Cinara cedri]
MGVSQLKLGKQDTLSYITLYVYETFGMTKQRIKDDSKRSSVVHVLKISRCHQYTPVIYIHSAVPLERPCTTIIDVRASLCGVHVERGTGDGYREAENNKRTTLQSSVMKAKT